MKKWSIRRVKLPLSQSHRSPLRVNFFKHSQARALGSDHLAQLSRGSLVSLCLLIKLKECQRYWKMLLGLLGDNIKVTVRVNIVGLQTYSQPWSHFNGIATRCDTPLCSILVQRSNQGFNRQHGTTHMVLNSYNQL